VGATQWVHSDRGQIAAALALPEEKVLVRNSGVGGSFGGRFVLSWQIHGALLALHTERPVKFVYSRHETFLARYHRQSSSIWVRHHADRDGRIVKVEARLLYECGPYSNTSGAAIGNGSSMMQGPYRIPNAEVEGWSVATNNGMTGSLRGFGVVEPIFAVESNLDNLARTLGLDGAELRRRNAMQEGDRWLFNQLQNRPTPVRELLDTVEALPLPAPLPADVAEVALPGGICSPTRAEHITRGIAVSAAAKNVCLSEGAPVDATALVTLRDGRITIECAAAEVGQGFVAVAIQLVQSVTGVSDVQITGADTLMAPAATTDGQQQTMTSGAAVAVAAARLKERFLGFIAREHRLDATALDIVDDHIVDAAGTPLMSVADGGMNLVFRATESFAQRRTRPIDEVDSSDPMHVAVNFSACRAVVDVDVELGLVRVVQIDVAQDAGRVVNPPQAHGQIEGGIVMGMGLAVMEDYQVAEGRMLTTDWESYQVPSSIDAPAVHTTFLEHAEPGIPFGVRGIAELPHVQAPPAILAAVRAATGRTLPSLPATPERVSGITPAAISESARRAPQPSTTGPWQAPVMRRDVGPWSADLQVTE
jgi:CO/xanthine dehydrogenase Mo-binding subunit